MRTRVISNTANIAIIDTKADKKLGTAPKVSSNGSTYWSGYDLQYHVTATMHVVYYKHYWSLDVNEHDDIVVLTEDEMKLNIVNKAIKYELSDYVLDFETIEAFWPTLLDETA